MDAKRGASNNERKDQLLSHAVKQTLQTSSFSFSEVGFSSPFIFSLALPSCIEAHLSLLSEDDMTLDETNISSQFGKRSFVWIVL